MSIQRRHEGDLHAVFARDAGRTLGFAVRATDATGTTTAYASLLGRFSRLVATYPRPSTGQPAIAGDGLGPGQTLQVSNGEWSRYADGVLHVSLGNAVQPERAALRGDRWRDREHVHGRRRRRGGYASVAVVQAEAKGVTQATLSVATAVVS